MSLNRRIWARIFMGTFLVTVIYMSFGFVHKHRKKKMQIEWQSTLIMDGIEFLTGGSPMHEKAVKILFHPGCDHCQNDAKQLREYLTLFSEVDLIWVSYDTPDSIVKFSRKYDLHSQPAVHFAYMDIEEMIDHHGDMRFPTFLVYDNHGRLLKKFEGATDPKDLLDTYEFVQE